MSFGERLRMLREEKKLRQSDLASILQMSNGTISNYENGVHFPDEDTLGKIADFFGVSVDFLLGRTDLRCQLEELNASIDSQHSLALLFDKIIALDTQHQLQLCQYVDYLISIQSKDKKQTDSPRKTIRTP